VFVMVFANNSGDRVGRRHWEENFREHCRDDVFVCSRYKSNYVHSTSKGKKLKCHGGTCPVISSELQSRPSIDSNASSSRLKPLTND
jgi:hypothetical protein